MTDPHPPAPSNRPVVLAIGLLLVVYAVGIGQGWVALPGGHVRADGVPHLAAIGPFALLLAAIAILPLVPAAAHWWESNLHKLLLAGGLALATLGYLAWGHPDASGQLAWTTLVHTLWGDFVPFIVLLFALFVISGGIRIEGDLAAHPLTNAGFLAAGAVLASLIGTTGAAMVLIRPLLETNRERKHVAHTVVVFIFVACNCGGLLLPLGDPPLFLGYLKGVNFLWTLSLWKSWLLVNGLLIAAYVVWDRLWFYPHEAARDIARDEARIHPLRFAGIKLNGTLLVGVILAVALLDPGKAVPGTSWQPWPYLREAVQLALVAVSLAAGAPRVRQANRFHYGPIVEVACLFVGIFICMQPALEILRANGAALGIDTPAKFFWASGSLSSVLDNAPTYLVFFETASSLSGGQVSPAGVPVAEPLLAGVSLGAVLMGAMTYIGNGPNFMVKTIAETSGVRMPSFFGYLWYSCLLLLPILALNVWLFVK